MTTDLIAEIKTKKVLLRKLLDGIKSCQTRFGSRTELATEDDLSIRQLCFAFEEVFLHGGKQSAVAAPSRGLWQMTTENLVPKSGLKTSESFSFWPIIKLQLSKHEAERFLLLHSVRTDLGRGRAWLRASLNEHSLERYILILLSFNLNLFYEDWAFLRDTELSSVLPQAAAGLGSVLFALSVDNPTLDSFDSSGMEKSVVGNHPIAESVPEIGALAQKQKKKKKKTPTAFVSFDDGEIGSSSEPPTPTSFAATATAKDVITSPKSTKEMSTGQGHGTHDSKPTTTTPTPSITIAGGNSDFSGSTSICSTSLKSADAVSIYSDCSDRIDALSLGGLMSPRLQPVGLGITESGEHDQTHDLIPVPSYSGGIDGGSDDFEQENNEEHEHEHDDGQYSEGSASASASLNLSIGLGNNGSRDESERLTKLKAILDHEVDIVSSLKVQLAEEQRKFKDESKILEARIEAMSKENEVLKVQLKKYIGAVSMLRGRRASMESDEDSASTANQDPPSEAPDYERKLIQVAEMHGELMEFNAYLHQELQRKDVLLRKLREELVDLRGPGVVDTDTNALTNHATRPNNERVLINIWVPSVFLTGATNDLHHVYQVFLRIRDTEWNVYRRYSQFHSLHRDLKKRDPIIGSFYFPPKKHLRNKDTKFVDERRRKLQEYLRKLMNHTLQTNPILAAHPDKNLLISILPFFGEMSVPPRPQRDRSAALLFRSSASPTREANLNSRWYPEDGIHPPYTGL